MLWWLLIAMCHLQSASGISPAQQLVATAWPNPSLAPLAPLPCSELAPVARRGRLVACLQMTVK